LLIEAAAKKTSIFLPSKLADYIGLGKPILAITPNNGPTARVVRKAGLFAADPLYPHEVFEVLNVILHKYKKGELRVVKSNIQTEYNAATTTKQVEEIFRDLL